VYEALVNSNNAMPTLWAIKHYLDEVESTCNTMWQIYSEHSVPDFTTIRHVYGSYEKKMSADFFLGHDVYI